MGTQAKGLIAMVTACTVWGLSSIYYKALSPVPAAEVLAHRTIWSLVFFMAVLALRGRMSRLGDCFRGRAKWLVTGAAFAISINWFGFIYSVQNGHAVEASLGYYIFPLVTVMLGVIFYRDRLRPVQWFAVGLAAAAVAILTWGLGVFPGISFLLAITFGIYGLSKKRLVADPMASVTAEVLILSPLAVAWLAGVHALGWGAVPGAAAFGRDVWHTVLLIAAGPLTAIPLMLLTYASQRISLPTLGLVQYLNPSLQFVVAVALFGEAFTPWHAIAFPLIWAGLAIYSLDGWKAWRRSSTAAAGVGTTRTGALSEGSAKPSAMT